MLAFAMMAAIRHHANVTPPQKESTAHDYLVLVDRSGALQRMHAALYLMAREQAGKEVSLLLRSSTARSAKAAQKEALEWTRKGLTPARKSPAAGSCPRRYARPRVERRHSFQCCADRDGARDVLRRARRHFPFIKTIFADAGYQGPKLKKVVAATGARKVEIVKRTDAHRFVVLLKRWIVERTLAWISRNRRLARDFERYARTIAAFSTSP